VPDEELASVREIYKKKHPTAYWVDFGDFRLMRMDTIKALRWVGGFGMAGDIKPEGARDMQQIAQELCKYSTKVVLPPVPRSRAQESSREVVLHDVPPFSSNLSASNRRVSPRLFPT